MKKIDVNISKTTLLSLLYWVIFTIPIVLIKNFTIYGTLIILSCLAYIPYRMFLQQKENPEIFKEKNSYDVIKKEIKPTIFAFVMFLGVLMIINSLIIPKFNTMTKNITYSTVKMSSEKVVDLENLEIYIDEENKKAYSFYKMDGKTGRTYMDTENLIPDISSELPERYGEFYKINDYEVAFATYKNQLYTEVLFKITKDNNKYLVKSYLPQENGLSLLAKAGFKKALTLNFKDKTQNDVYINRETKEIALSNNDIIITSKYAETPYNKEDYFSYRYDIFNNYVEDNTMIPKNLNVTLLNTYSDISDDIKRVTFYLENSEDTVYTYSEVIEIIFAEVSYVFRTGIIDTTNIESIVRAK